MRTKGRARQPRIAGAKAQGIEQQGVVSDVGVDTPLAESVECLLVRLKLLHHCLGRKLRQDRGPGGTRLRGHLFGGKIVV